jgi:hypothetical protein
VENPQGQYGACVCGQLSMIYNTLVFITLQSKLFRKSRFIVMAIALYSSANCTRSEFNSTSCLTHSLFKVCYIHFRINKTCHEFFLMPVPSLEKTKFRWAAQHAPIKLPSGMVIDSGTGFCYVCYIRCCTYKHIVLSHIAQGLCFHSRITSSRRYGSYHLFSSVADRDVMTI